MVGAKGFEPSTLWSQTRCATRLRYAPTPRILTAGWCPALCWDDIFPKRTRVRNPGMQAPRPVLPWLDPGAPFPAAGTAWGADTDAPGLLAAGGDLSVQTLLRAYAGGIFPWFSQGQPILWWSTDPRMVLHVAEFKLHRSLRKSLQKFVASGDCDIRFDTDFAAVIEACAGSARRGAPGTWIQPAMVQAYCDLHAAGRAHSVEVWQAGSLVAGLYCVARGRAVFGESMFTTVPDASKIALAALVGFCRYHGVVMVDCQQNTQHLASLGAREIARAAFLTHVDNAMAYPELDWRFDTLYWKCVAAL